MTPLAVLATVVVAYSQTTEKTVEQHADGTVTETTVTDHGDGTVTETTRTFTPEVRQSVVTYFEPYAEESYGLPVEVVQQIEVDRIPAIWRNQVIEPGTVITEEYRPMLVKAPRQLVSVFPEHEGYRYYIAGGNVVVVDEEYQVIDSLRIPTVRFDVEE